MAAAASAALAASASRRLLLAASTRASVAAQRRRAGALVPPRSTRATTMSTSTAGGATTSTSAAAASNGDQPPPDPLMQYVVLRSDLWKKDKKEGGGWPLGSLAAQAAHAATAALWLSRDTDETKAYCRSTDGSIDRMTKVVLEADDEKALRELAKSLEGAGVGHKLWIEQPEDEATALASFPARKSALAGSFSGLKLCRAAVGGGGKK